MINNTFYADLELEQLTWNYIISSIYYRITTSYSKKKKKDAASSYTYHMTVEIYYVFKVMAHLFSPCLLRQSWHKKNSWGM
jgi:hypothetical protein